MFMEQCTRVREVFDVRVDKGERSHAAIVQVGMDEGGGDEHGSETLYNGRDTEIACYCVFAEDPHLLSAAFECCGDSDAL